MGIKKIKINEAFVSEIKSCLERLQSRNGLLLHLPKIYFSHILFGSLQIKLELMLGRDLYCANHPIYYNHLFYLYYIIK